MQSAPGQPPIFWKIVPDVFAFALGLGVTWLQGWTTTDLVWSLWLSSLTLGYATILSTIAAGVYVGVVALARGEMTAQQRLTLTLVGSLVALFFLGFFSFHFCAFHAVHAGFLSSFFPLAGVPKQAFNSAFMNPVQLWKTALQYLFPTYGIFLIAALVAERQYVFESLTRAVKLVREGLGAGVVATVKQAGTGKSKALSDPFTRPYLNVIRMHLLIFFFFFCHALKIESFVVFVVVYCVYFFPWRAFKSEPAPATA